jgi:adenylate cyclase
MSEQTSEAEYSPVERPNWKDKLVVVGSKATGNDLTDAGATPLEKSAFLMSKHWNIANSFLQDRFVKQMPLSGRLGVIVVLGAITTVLSSRLRALAGFQSVMLIVVAWIALTMVAFVRYRYWIPLALPVLGSLLANYAVLVMFRFRVEQTERTRIKSIFSKMVSPSIVNELLDTERLALAGERRELTILFADIRRFTEVTDESQALAERLVKERGLSEAATEKWLDQQARDILNTVNLYLATMADMVKRHNGTLDKYIGDCVMAFWGAPTPNEKHSRDCVLAAIDAQRAIARLNRLREEENVRREHENKEREARGELPLPPLPILQVGTGINTGMVTVGLMGSEEHSFNYTVFGREVNLASRLEGASGYGRILIGAATHDHLRRCDPTLAEKCESLPPISIKGFREMVSLYEVPWVESDSG